MGRTLIKSKKPKVKYVRFTFDVEAPLAQEFDDLITAQDFYRSKAIRRALRHYIFLTKNTSERTIVPNSVHPAPPADATTGA